MCRNVACLPTTELGVVWRLICIRGQLYRRVRGHIVPAPGLMRPATVYCNVSTPARQLSYELACVPYGKRKEVQTAM